jgi:L-methionine (R)-S-oxide reductase
MAETLTLTASDKEGIYQELLPQLTYLMDDQVDDIANMANLAAVLREAFGFFWVGFYRVSGDNLILGPFQGPLACTRIRRGRGVCGSAWDRGETLVVPNVDEFPGHIACSSLSKSEIVVPLRCRGAVVGVLDIDSDQLNTFDQTDRLYLEKICALLYPQT